MAKYFPLQLIDLLVSLDEELSYNYNAFKAYMDTQIDTPLPDDREEYVKDMTDMYTNLSLKEYIGKLYQFEASELTQHNPAHYRGMMPFQMTTEIKDVLLYPRIVSLWAENKQVYKPNNTFLAALLESKNFSLTKTDLEHLPVHTLFFDFTETSITGSFEGAFVNVRQYPDLNKVAITIYLITPDMNCWSHYLMLDYDHDGENLTKAISKFCDMRDIWYESEELPLTTLEIDENGEPVVKNSTIKAEIRRHTLVNLILQLLCFITSKEPDVSESSITKSTYKKPTSVPQNKFSEVRIQEVGVRYGSSVKRLIKDEKAKQQHTEKKEKNADAPKQKRTSPRPHFRCAHWQRFWTGAGRTLPVARWIQPVFVGFGDKEKVDVIIHKMN